MQIAQDLAGYTLGGADLLRRAMGKKKPEEMAKQRQTFIDGAVQRGVAEETAQFIFDLMEKFAGYGFNKSHSAAYALVSYQTLWLKTHYPGEFMAAALSADMDSTDKVKVLVDESRKLGLTIVPPHVNRSGYRFSAAGEGQVVYGLGAIKGVGEAAIEDIVATRARGAFTDLFDFCRRVDLRKANRRVLESLIRAGAMDGLGDNRATLMAQIPLALRMAEQQQAMHAAGQEDLFGVAQQPDASASVLDALPKHREWQQAIRLQGEFDTLGLYLSGHPLDAYASDRKALGVKRLDLAAELSPGKQGRGDRLRLAGQVVAINKRDTQRGAMASVLLDDGHGRADIAFFSDVLERVQNLLVPGNLLFVEVTASHDKYRDAMSLRADNAISLDAMRELSARQLQLSIKEEHWQQFGESPAKLVERLASLLNPFLGGACRVSVDYQTQDYRGALALGEHWTVSLKPELLDSLYDLLGEDAVNIGYQESVDSAVRQSSV